MSQSASDITPVPEVPEALHGFWRFTFLEGHELAAGEHGLRVDATGGGGELKLPGGAVPVRVVEAAGGEGGRKPALRFVRDGAAGGGELKLKRENAARGSVDAGGAARTFTAEREAPEPATPEPREDTAFGPLSLKRDEVLIESAIDASGAARLRGGFRRVLAEATDAMPLGHFMDVAKALKVHKGNRIEENPREQALLFEHAMFDLPLGSEEPNLARRFLLDASATGDAAHDAARAAVADARWSVVVAVGEPTDGVRLVHDLLHFQRLPVLDAEIASARESTPLAVRLVPGPGAALRLGAAYVVDKASVAIVNDHLGRVMRSPTPPTLAGTRRLSRELLGGAFRRKASRVPLDV